MLCWLFPNSYTSDDNDNISNSLSIVNGDVMTDDAPNPNNISGSGITNNK